MQYSIFCDFDGTITKDDSIDLILQSFSVNEKWKGIERQWASGVIGSKECLMKQFSEIRMDRNDIFDIAKKLRLEDGFIEFSRFCNNNNIPLYIISDGISSLIQYFLRLHGLHFTAIYANYLEFTSGRKAEFVPLSDSDTSYSCRHEVTCANCKSLVIKHIIRTDHIRLDDTIYIGDGASDISGALECETVFAKEKLATLLYSRGKKSHLFNDFQEILKAIKNDQHQRMAGMTVESEAK